MKGIKFNYKCFAFAPIVTVCIFLSACHNPIIGTWWEAHEPEPGYHTLIKQLPPEIHYIINEIITTIVVKDPTVIVQSMEIIEIGYIIFAGEQVGYNEKAPGPGGNTWLTQLQYDTNNAYITSMVNALRGNSELLLVVHGHANPTLDPGAPGYEELLIELAEIASARANNVTNVFLSRGIASERIRTNSFAGNRTVSDPNHPELNRRVEVILIRIETITR